MELFNIGAGELLLIALIGLLLFGPEDLLKIARTVSGYLNKAQRIWREFSTTLDMDLLQSGIEEPTSSKQQTAAPIEATTTTETTQTQDPEQDG